MLIKSKVYGMKNTEKFFKVNSYQIKKWFQELNMEKGPRGRKPVDPSMEEKICDWL